MPKILVVDDCIELIEDEIMAIQNADLGYDAEGINSPFKALEMLEKSKYDLVILDLMMPGKNGIEMLHEIKRRWPETKIILYSGYTDKITESKLYEEGVDLILSKPAPLDLFINALKSLLDPNCASTVVIVNGYKLREIKKQVLATMIQKVLRKTAGNTVTASSLMGISRECLSFMMKKYGIIR